jgi:hypothetical protein
VGVVVPVALIVGARPLWSDACVAAGRFDAPGCRNPADDLPYSDDDAWRMATILRASLGNDAVAVVTRTDDSTAFAGDDAIPDLAALCGPDPGALGRACLTRAVAALARSHDGEKLSLVLYFSGHGSGGYFHLEDGAWQEKDLVAAALAGAPPGSSVEVFIGDACESAQTKGAFHPTRHPVLPATSAGVELLVDSDARYVLAARGSSFTSILSTAFAGAAPHGDAGGLREYLDREEPRFRIATDVRAMGRDDRRATTALTPSARGATLSLPGDGGDARWIIERVVPRGDGGEEHRVFYDLVADGPAHLSVPPGRWRISRVPADEVQAWITGESAFLVGYDCGTADLVAGARHTAECHLLPDGLPDLTKGGPSSSVAEYLRGVGGLQRRAHRRPTLPFGGLHLDVGADVAAPVLDRQAPLGGLDIEGTDDLYWIRAIASVRVSRELGPSADPARAASVEARLGSDFLVPWASTRGFRLGVEALVGGGMLALAGADGLTQRGPVVGADLGVTTQLLSRGWTLGLGFGWRPVVEIVADPDGSGRLWPDVARLGGTLRIGHTL